MRVAVWVVVAVGALVSGGPASAVADESAVAGNGNGTGSPYPVIEIWKAQRRLQFRHNGTVQDYRVVLGQQPRSHKEHRGDGRTPVGRYYISDKNPGSRFHRFLGISYPNIDDAERAYQQQVIGVEQWADIYLANLRGESPPSYTPLGGRVGIHGLGGRPDVPIDWTEGCVAVPDRDIEFIFERAPLGTPVIIHE